MTGALKQPQAYPGDISSGQSGSNCRREYRDPLGRALIGTVTFTREGFDPVTAAVNAGVCDVTLPPGIYTTTATLYTTEGVQVVDSSTVTVP